MIRASLLALRGDAAAASTSVRTIVSLASKRPRTVASGWARGAAHPTSTTTLPIPASSLSSSSPLATTSPPSSPSAAPRRRSNLQVRSYIFLPASVPDVARAVRSALFSDARRRRTEVTLKLRATGEQVREKLRCYRNRALARYGGGGEGKGGRMRNLLLPRLLLGAGGGGVEDARKGATRVLREEARLTRSDRRGLLKVLREERALLDAAAAAAEGGRRRRLMGRMEAARTSLAGRMRARRDDAMQLWSGGSLAGVGTARMSARLRSRLLSRVRLLRNVLYYRPVVVLTEPAHRSWFDGDGFPLTSRDRITGRFVNPWNSESTNGHHSLADLWRWRTERWRMGAERLEPSSGATRDAGADAAASAGGDAPSRDVSIDADAILAPPSSDDRIKLSWLGHSTCLIQQHSFTFLTDPVFSPRAFPVQFMGPKRYAPPALTVPELPNVDVCLISHDHYDHLDYNSVLDLVESGKVRYWAVPLGLKAWLMDEAGVDGKDIVELEWWEGVKFSKREETGTVEIEGLVREFATSAAARGDNVADSADNGTLQLEENSRAVSTYDAQGWVADRKMKLTDDGSVSNRAEAILTCAPAQHWCGRTPFDRNRRLWCSWAVRTAAPSSASAGNSPGTEDAGARVVGNSRRRPPAPLSFYFAGDTGLPPTFPLHRQIGERLGPFDLSALPIGAYAPSFFMGDSHCDPREAVTIHGALRSRRSVAVHWGTFALADERHDEPPRLLLEEVSRTRSGGQGGGAVGSAGGVDVDFVALRRGNSIESPEWQEEGDAEVLSVLGRDDDGVLVGSLNELATIAGLSDRHIIPDEENEEVELHASG